MFPPSEMGMMSMDGLEDTRDETLQDVKSL